MSVSTSSGIMVGLPYAAVLATGIKEDLLQSCLDDETIASSSRYYDSSPKDNLVGFWVYEPADHVEFNPADLVKRVEKLSRGFRALFGVDAKVYSTLFVV